MADLNEGLQANLLMLVCVIFLAIQFFNYPYYRDELNQLNISVIALIVIYSFSRVLIRSAVGAEPSSDGADLAEFDTGELLDEPQLKGSISGRDLPEEYKGITRSAFFRSDASNMESFIIYPLILLFILSDLLFAWHIMIQFYWWTLESRRGQLFRYLTCMMISAEKFRKKYMQDTLDKDYHDDDNKDALVLNTRLVTAKVFAADDIIADGAGQNIGDGKPIDVKDIHLHPVLE